MIALLGASGYIGSRFRTHLDGQGTAYAPISRADLNIFDPVDLASALDDLSADFLINCAGYTGKPNVDACENHKCDCLMGNAVLPGVVAKACSEVGIPFGHVSSGCIFTGQSRDGQGFTEEDEPNFSFRQNNCSFYSGTKALGEEVLAAECRCYIWRMRIPFDKFLKSFLGLWFPGEPQRGAVVGRPCRGFGWKPQHVSAQDRLTQRSARPGVSLTQRKTLLSGTFGQTFVRGRRPAHSE